MATMRGFLTSPGGVMALVFSILGSVFGLVGAGLAVGSWATRRDADHPAALNALTAVGLAFLGVAVPLLALGLILAGRRKGQLAAEEHLRQFGLPTQATIVAVEQDYRVRINRRHPWRVRYRYSTPGGTHEGLATMMDLPDQYRPGETVSVAYDAGDERRSVLAS